MRHINHLAVLVSVVLHQILGTLWYSPFLFVPARLAALGRPASDATLVDPIALGMDVATWVVATYVMAFLVQRTTSTTAAKGATLGVLVWLVEIPALAPKLAFAGVSPIVTAIDLGNLLLVTVLTCTILGAWQKKGTAT
jgi:hypothetical protein